MTTYMNQIKFIFYLLFPSVGTWAQGSTAVTEFHKSVNGIDCYAFTYQDITERKPLLVLVHGSPGKHADWNKYLKDKELQAKFRILAIDRLGFGKSGERRAYPDLKLQAKVVHRFIKQYANGEQVYLMGHSVGGPVTTRCVIDYPNDVNKLILLAPAISAEHEQPRWYNRLAAKPFLYFFLPKDMKISQGEMMPLPVQLEEMQPLLATIQTPVYLFHGKADMIAPYGNALYVERLLGKNLVFFKSFDKENHFLHITRVKEIKELLLSLK
jgi:pimeloyl-ACP methyl ester carboxylesterase